MGKFVAITGAPHSGKTTLTVQLGQSIAQQGTSVLIVFCDAHIPPKEYLLKKNEDTSLGELLTATELSSKMLLQAATSITANLAVIGYNKTDLSGDYPMLTNIGVSRFLDKIKSAADVILFDFSAESTLLTQHVSKLADSSVTVLQSTPKSIVWAKRNDGFSAPILVCNDYQHAQAKISPTREHVFVLPHCKELEPHFCTANSFQPVAQKGYLSELHKLQQLLEKEKGCDR